MVWVLVVGGAVQGEYFFGKRKNLNIASGKRHRAANPFPRLSFPILLLLQEKRFPKGYFKINLCTIFYS